MIQFRLTWIAVILAFGLLGGCRRYGDVSSHAYEHAESLFAACSRRDVDQLAMVRHSLNASHASGELGDREFKWLNGIASQAESGDWEAAMGQTRRLMNDQIQRR